MTSGVPVSISSAAFAFRVNSQLLVAVAAAAPVVTAPCLAAVPLIFAGSALPHRGKSTENVSLVDVLPTLLAAFDEQPDYHIDGVSLWPYMRGETTPGREIFAEVDDHPWNSQAVVVDDRKRVHLETPRLADFEYDLNRDPHEESPPLRAMTPFQTEHFETLQAAFLALRSRSHGTAQVKLDAQTVEQLRSLGYVD